MEEKLCKGKCGLKKPLSEFYKRSGSDSYVSECKECMKARSRDASDTNDLIPRAASEILAINYLHTNHIPALPGKALKHSHVDVLAFGCVRIEVKYARLEFCRGVEKFTFVSTPQQKAKGYRAEIVMLICDYGNERTYHLFKSTSPVFYINGEIKTGFTFTPGAFEAKKHGNNRVVMTELLMIEAKDQIALIHEQLKDYCSNLKGD